LINKIKKRILLRGLRAFVIFVSKDAASGQYCR